MSRRRFLVLAGGVVALGFIGRGIWSALAARPGGRAVSVDLGAQMGGIQPFMWAGGLPPARSHLPNWKLGAWAQVQANIDHASRDRVRWSSIQVEVTAADLSGGTYDWAWLETVAGVFADHGLSLLPRLATYSSSAAALDVLAPVLFSPDAESLAQYGRLVGEMARRLRGRALAYAVENELDVVNARLTRQGKTPVPYANYRRLLDTAYRAIKEADPSVPVMNFGPSGGGLALVRTAELEKTEGMAAALRFYQETSKSGLGNLKWMSRPDMKARMDTCRAALDDRGPYDAYQLHHYQAAETFAELLAWLRGALASSRGRDFPIVAGEIGYNVEPKKAVPAVNGGTRQAADASRFSPSAQVDAVVQKIAVLLGDGVGTIQCWPYRQPERAGGESPAVGLYEPSDTGFTPRPAALAYGYLTGRLQGAHARVRPLEVPGATAVALDGTAIVWSNGGSKTVALPSGFRSARDVSGRPIPVSNGRVRLGAAPVFWQA